MSILDALAAAAAKLEGAETRVFPTPGELAAYIDPRTVNTDALQLLDSNLTEIAHGQHDRLIWTMPPQEGKSVRISRVFPYWLLLHKPDTRIAIVSYEANIARRWGRAIRNDILTHPELGITVRTDTAAAHEWQLEGHDGGVITVGIGGALTGRPVDCMIIDDPVKGRAEADSQTYRDNAWEWWTETGATRLAPGAPVILLMTRWHEADLAGSLLTSESAAEWTHINIPALADHDPTQTKDPLGRQPGEWLTSARGRTPQAWERIRRQVGSRAFNALYQGRPAPAEGGIFKRDWWRYYTVPKAYEKPDGTWHAPGTITLIQSWDLAFKDTTSSDYVVGQVWARQGTQGFLLDQVRGRMDFPSTCVAIRNLTAKWPQTTGKYIEDKANGPAVISQLRKEIGGIIPVTPKDSKLARAHAVTPLIEAGDIALPDPTLAPWIGDLIEELAGFPNGAHDDQVDTLTQALWALFLNRGGPDDFMGELIPRR